MANRVSMKLYGIGEIPAEHAARVLFCINSAYDGLWLLDQLTSSTPNQIQRALPLLRDFWSDGPLNLTLPTSRQSLELKGVVLQSPGFWEFLGSLNPLKTLCDYINQRHERKKDNTYRNTLESRRLEAEARKIEADAKRLEIENRIMAIRAVPEAVDAFRKAGIPDEQISAVIRDLVVIPLLKVESLQDKGAISTAEMPVLKEQEATEDVDA